MSNNMTEKGRKAAALKVEKRAAALRENLKRRKVSGNARVARNDTDQEDKNAKLEDSQ